MLECVPLSLDSTTAFLFFIFINEHIFGDDSKTITELKDAIVSGLGHLTSQMADKFFTDPGAVWLPEVTRWKRAQTVSFSLNGGDGKPMAGATDDIVNLLCHFIGSRMIPHFWKCYVKYTNY